MWYGVQTAACLKVEVRQLEKDKEALVAELERQEDLTGFYRRQVLLEAQMGLALMRLAG